jgi:hypothetical protein
MDTVMAQSLLRRRFKSVECLHAYKCDNYIRLFSPKVLQMSIACGHEVISAVTSAYTVTGQFSDREVLVKRLLCLSACLLYKATRHFYVQIFIRKSSSYVMY